MRIFSAIVIATLILVGLWSFFEFRQAARPQHQEVVLSETALFSLKVTPTFDAIALPKSKQQDPFSFEDKVETAENETAIDLWVNGQKILAPGKKIAAGTTLSIPNLPGVQQASARVIPAEIRIKIYPSQAAPAAKALRIRLFKNETQQKEKTVFAENEAVVETIRFEVPPLEEHSHQH